MSKTLVFLINSAIAFVAAYGITYVIRGRPEGNELTTIFAVAFIVRLAPAIESRSIYQQTTLTGIIK